MSERRILVTPVVPMDAVDDGALPAAAAPAPAPSRRKDATPAPVPMEPTVPVGSSLERAVVHEALRQSSKQPSGK